MLPMTESQAIPQVAVTWITLLVCCGNHGDGAFFARNPFNRDAFVDRPPSLQALRRAGMSRFGANEPKGGTGDVHSGGE